MNPLPLASTASRAPRVAIVLPVCNEAACLPRVLTELRPWAARVNGVVAVGLNDCTDESAAIARAHGVIVGSTPWRGYGGGCLAAMSAVRAHGGHPAAWIFMAADGAHDPAELVRLVAAWRGGADLVLGQRTMRRANWAALGHGRAISNVALALWASMLARQCYLDLGPYRLISDPLVRRLPWRETTWGWTIAPQVLAPALGVRIAQFTVCERPRLAGEQKVSRLGWRHSLRVGVGIAAAAWRASRHRARIVRATSAGAAAPASMPEGCRPDLSRCS